MRHAADLDRSMLSVVVPVFDEQEALPELERRLAGAVEPLRFEAYEFLIVSDGSRDRSEELIRGMVARDPRYRGVFLSRNFGHQEAISVGLRYARGSVVAVIDGDLQDPPEAIAGLVGALAGGADVAFGVRTGRKESLPIRLAYSGFYRLLRAVSAIEIPLDSGDFCCMRRPVVDAILALPERRRFLRGLRAWVGYRQVGVAYERAARHSGTPKYTLRKLVALAYDGLFSFSTLPIRLMQVAGFVLSALAIAVAMGYVIWSFLTPERFPAGFASQIVSIWFFAGVQLFCLGIVGEYVARTCDEARGRPPAVVREVVASRQAESDEGGPGAG
jgi:dolichol-phosphate mannosyltransferase